MKIRGAVLEESGRTRPYKESRPLTISELELDSPESNELVVQIEIAGICHSDLSVVNGDRPRPLPMLLGHEASGRVIDVGEGINDVSIGQRVVMTFLPRCGTCVQCGTNGRLPCERGTVANNEGRLMGGRRLHRDGSLVQHHLGVSAFATHALVDRRSVVPVSDDIPPEVAAMLGCAILTGGGALLNAARPEKGNSVAIVGLGGVGMVALLVAQALGTGSVVGIDSQPDKLNSALSLGAHRAYTPEEALDAEVKADVVIEAAGHPRAFETAVQLTAPGGSMTTVGLPSPSAKSTIHPLGLTTEARVIQGSYLGSAVPDRDVPLFAQMWREGRLPVERLISSTLHLEQINEAMDVLAEGQAIRQLIRFESES
ncbi:zinc-binding dehydrogenase [Brevibacterium oceani]|uniref:zinc-binding dehydrogenase n=1 Tax=Brevibacterium oceani TaxID=358099 RepID=UPI001B31C5E7|nr:alcohol dehydrogenase catalytic domain-containing protein [Brevibacterium oceani]